MSAKRWCERGKTKFGFKRKFIIQAQHRQKRNKKIRERKCCYWVKTARLRNKYTINNLVLMFTNYFQYNYNNAISYDAESLM